MKKKLNKILGCIIIFAVTLASGFVITAISFSLFDALTTNQMRILFAVDIILLLAIGSIVWLKYESRLNCERKKKELEQKHNERMKKNIDFSKEIANVIEYTGIAV